MVPEWLDKEKPHEHETRLLPITTDLDFELDMGACVPSVK